MNINFKDEYPKTPEGFHRAVNNAVNMLTENAETTEKRKSPFRIIVLAAAVITLLTFSAFGADTVYDYFVKMENNKVTVELPEIVSVAENIPEYVKLEFGYMPDYIAPFDAPYKFNVMTESGDTTPSGLTFQLFKADLAEKLEIFYVGSVAECMFGDNMGAVMKIDTGIESDGDEYDKQFLIYFDDFGYILRCYVSERISEDEMMKIAGNISLVESDKENAFIIDTYIPTFDNGGIIAPSEDVYSYSAGEFINKIEEISVVS